MSEDAERDTDNPGPFEAQTELGSVCTSLALEEVARLRDAEREATGPERDLAEQALEKLEWLAREFDGCAEANSRDFDGVWAMVEIGKRGKVYYAVNGRRYPREEAAALLKRGRR